MGEFEIIEKYFKAATQDSDVKLGIGDDCAVLSVANDQQIIVTTDTLVEHTHFPAAADAKKIGYRTCATALSDIAAMGGVARWASLALTAPEFDEVWFSRFVAGIRRSFAVDNTVLIGGDLTRGPLAISWHITGTVERGKALRRSGCRVGDAIFVTGELGGAAYALSVLDAKDIEPSVLNAYWAPQPRLALGRAIAAIANSCIDISDGFLGDLHHLLNASTTSAVLNLDTIPLASVARELSRQERLALALNGGDDYELCFTADKIHRQQIETLRKQHGVAITEVGEIVGTQDQHQVTTTDGDILRAKSYQHFR